MVKYRFQFKKNSKKYFSGKGGFEFRAPIYSIPYSAIKNRIHGYERNEDFP